MVDIARDVNEYGEAITLNERIKDTGEKQRKINIDTVIGEKVEAVCKEFAITPGEVYIPGSSTDVLPAIDALQNSHILYADTDEEAVKALKESGYNAINLNIEASNPPNAVDLLVLNGISVNKPLDAIKHGGFVLSDGRMGSAENIAINHKGFKLVGVIVHEETQDGDEKKGNKETVRRDNLDYYTKRLSRTEAELAEARRTIGMSLLGASPLPKTEKPMSTPPQAQGYIFQK